jgi:hypothetical protein
MNRSPNVERVLLEYLADDGGSAPDYVLDVVADRIAGTRQRRAWPLPWRPFEMNYVIKIAAGVAAVIVLAVLGWNLLPGRSNGVGVLPTATATPTTSRTPTPSVSAVFPAWYTQHGDGAGILSAGSQTTRNLVPGASFAVPDGWVNDGDYAPAYYLFPDTPANEAEYGLSKQKAQEIVLATTVEDNMFAICDATGLFPGGTAAQVIDALVANEALSTTQPVEVTIGGLSGRQVDVQLSPDWTSKCQLSADDPPTYDYKDARSRVVMLDTPDGRTIGISISSRNSSDFDAFLAEAMPVVESFRFDVGPEASPS